MLLLRVLPASFAFRPLLHVPGFLGFSAEGPRYLCVCVRVGVCAWRVVCRGLLQGNHIEVRHFNLSRTHMYVCKPVLKPSRGLALFGSSTKGRQRGETQRTPNNRLNQHLNRHVSQSLQKTAFFQAVPFHLGRSAGLVSKLEVFQNKVVFPTC